MNERDKRAVTVNQVNVLLLNASLSADSTAAARCRDEAFRLMTLHNISINEVSWPVKHNQGAVGGKYARPEPKQVFTIACQGGQKRRAPEGSAAEAKDTGYGSGLSSKDGPTFGDWDSRVHWELEQRAEIGYARTIGDLDVIEENESSIKLRPKFFSPSEPETFTPTLDECNCLYFKHRGRPCQHMYFFAHRKGLFDYRAFPLLTDKERLQLRRERKEEEAERRRRQDEEERQERERGWREAEPERLKAERRRATWWYKACDRALEILGIKVFSLLCGALFLSGQYFLFDLLGLIKYSLVKRVLIIEFVAIIFMWMLICSDNDSGGSDGLDRFVHGDPGDY